MIFVDSHCHLDILDTDLVAVVERALANNVKKMVVPGTNLNSSQDVIALAEKFEQVYAAVGIHPHEVATVTDGDFEEIALLARHPKVVAIGEIGLDYHYPPYDEWTQRLLLQKMLDLASQVDKPVILHSRDALSDLMAIVTEWAQSNPLKSGRSGHGVFHMFEGGAASAASMIEQGFAISVGGNITFKNNQRSVEMLQVIGLSNLLLETDSPYISPVPFRGTPNEPSRIPLIAAKVAEITQTQVELVAAVTTKNAEILFDLG